MEEYPSLYFEYHECFVKYDMSDYLEFQHAPPLMLNYIKPLDGQENIGRSLGAGSMLTIFIIDTDPYMQSLVESSNYTTLSEYMYYYNTDIYDKKLIHKQILISGYRAQYGKFYFNKGKEYEPYDKRIRFFTIFDYNDRLINIYMDSREEEAVELEKHYNHLLDTFHILE